MSEDDVVNLDSVVDKWLGKTLDVDIERFKAQSIYNFGKAGVEAGKTIISIVERQAT